MYRRLRNLLVIGSLLILAAGFYRFRLEREPLRAAQQLAAQIEATEIVERGDIILNVSATGSLSPSERLPLFFVTPGVVAEVLVEEGEMVEEGQVLARLDTRSLELAVREAELALESQQIAFDVLTAPVREADLTVAQAAVYAANAQVLAAQEPPDVRNEQVALLQLEVARNQLWQAQIQRDEAQAAAAAGYASGEQVAQAEAAITRAQYEVYIAEQEVTRARNATVSEPNVAAARAALVNAQAALNRLLDGPSERDVEIVDAQLQIAYLALELARYQLTQAELTAPFAGVVARQNLTVGEPPPTSGPAVELVDDSSFLIDLPVDELDIAQMQVGQRVEITLDALPGEVITGSVTTIDDVATDLGGVITYRVRVTLDPTEAPVRVGMSATAEIVVDEVRDVLRVRNRFIRLDRRTEQAYIMVRRPDGQLEEVAVELGRRDEVYSEIVGGLSAGDEVVLLSGGTFDPFNFAP